MHSSNNKRLTLLIFSFSFLVNVTSTGGHFDWWDGVETFLITESMVLKHSIQIYPDSPSLNKLPSFSVALQFQGMKPVQKENISASPEPVPFYSVRSLFLAAVAVPFYYIAMLFSVSPILIIGISVMSLIISLISVVIFRFSLEIYGSKKIAFVLSLIFSICSFIWPYNSLFFAQPLQALSLITAAFFIYLSRHNHFSFMCNYSRLNRNKPLYFSGLGGLFLGLSVFAHPSSIIVVPGFIVFCILSMGHNRKNISCFLIILGIMLCFMLFVNYWRFGSITQFGYGTFGSAFTPNIGWQGLLGLWISPGAGLISYFPIVILLPIAFKYMYKKDKSLFFLSAYVIIVSWLYFGMEPFYWFGGPFAWGPRYLVHILPFITIIFGSILKQSNRRIFLKLMVISLCVVGFSVNLGGKLIWTNYGTAYGWLVEVLWDDPNYWDIMNWNPYYSPIILHMKALIYDFVSTLDPANYRNTHWSWVSIGLAPCSYDVYIFCKFGIIPILAMSAVIAIVAFIILKTISSRYLLGLRRLTISKVIMDNVKDLHYVFSILISRRIEEEKREYGHKK
jgi:hypothetical protein